MSALTPCIEAGDRLRISVALLKQMYRQADHLSDVVVLVDVQTGADGVKVLVLTRGEP